jgi:hypothetical protein
VWCVVDKNIIHDDGESEWQIVAVISESWARDKIRK